MHRVRNYEPVYPLVFDQDTLSDQIKALFFKSLRSRVEEEHDIARYSEIVDRFYQSRFKEVYDARAVQISAEVFLQWERFGNEGLPQIDQRIEDAFEGLLDFFIIQYCPDLTGMVLPEAILHYERAQVAQVDLRTMFHHFLDFEREAEVVYTDFFTMPQQLLSNACKSFLSAPAQETVYFICDLSVKGNCKEGFAMTDQALYWRAPFGRPRTVRYTAMQQVQKGKDWLLINGHFFTVNPSLNLKMYKLLKKLRRWYCVASASVGAAS